MKKFSLILAKIISETGLTQKQLAEKLNVSDRTITSYMAGKTEPTRSMLCFLCEEYGISPEYIITGEGPVWKKNQDSIFSSVPSDDNLHRVHVEDGSFSYKSTSPSTSASDAELQQLRAKLKDAEHQISSLTESNRNLSQVLLSMSKK